MPIHLSACQIALPIEAGGENGRFSRLGIMPHSTMPPMPSSAALLRMDLISSTRLSIEKIFLMPLTGLSLETSGVTFFIVATGPTCRNSTSSASITASSSSGRVMARNALAATGTIDWKATSKGCCIIVSACSNSERALRNIEPIISQPPTNQPMTSTVLVSSRLLATLPSLRASLSFLDVGFSVLSAPSFSSAIPFPRSREPAGHRAILQASGG